MSILILSTKREAANKLDHWAQTVSSSLGEFFQLPFLFLFFFFFSVIDLDSIKEFLDCLWSACLVLSVLRCAGFMTTE